jgi:hypothetical protein
MTEEEIASAYSAMLDSVALINAARANPDDYADDETVVARNVEHLELMIAKDFWTDEDMTSVQAAIDG